MMKLMRLNGEVIAEGDSMKLIAEPNKADLYKADLYKADLYKADLYGADLRGADLYGADLSAADLRGANLCAADLCGADLYGADLSAADLRGANLCAADLCAADLYAADLSAADLRGANLCGAGLGDTCLDPAASPNGDVDGFTPDGEFVIGYRTRKAGHIDKYRDGQYYSANWFSVADTECHPGLYLCPTIRQARNYCRTDMKLIRVRTRPCDVHKAGTKWRCRWFEVIGPA